MVTKLKPPKSVAVKPDAGLVAKQPVAGKPRRPAGVVAAPTPSEGPVTPDVKARREGAANVNALKKKDLIDSVVQITGGKKKAVRDVVEATLKVLGDALSKGVMLNLPPFGKAKVSRQQDGTSGKPMTVKLRRSTAVRKPKEALADAED